MDNMDLVLFASVIIISGLCMYIFEEKKKIRIKRKKKFDEDVETGVKILKNGCSKFNKDRVEVVFDTK